MAARSNRPSMRGAVLEYIREGRFEVDDSMTGGGFGGVDSYNRLLLCGFRSSGDGFQTVRSASQSGPLSTAELLSAAKSAVSRPIQRRWSPPMTTGQGPSQRVTTGFRLAISPKLRRASNPPYLPPHIHRLPPGNRPLWPADLGSMPPNALCNRYRTPLLRLHTPREHIFPALRTDCNSIRAGEQCVALRSRAVDRYDQV